MAPLEARFTRSTGWPVFSVTSFAARATKPFDGSSAPTPTVAAFPKATCVNPAAGGGSAARSHQHRRPTRQ